MGWNVVVMMLSGTRLMQTLDPWMLGAGGLAGIAAGWCTVGMSRPGKHFARRRLTLSGFLSAYFLGLFVYWLIPFAVDQFFHLLSGRAGFDAKDGLTILLIYLYGTVLFGFILLPLCAVSQGVTLAVFNRTAGARSEAWQTYR